jgi:hypothetical protein
MLAAIRRARDAGNKPCELAFIAEGTHNTGANDEALAGLVRNLCRPTEHGHARRGPKLSMVCVLQQRRRRRRDKLRFHHI